MYMTQLIQLVQMFNINCGSYPDIFLNIWNYVDQSLYKIIQRAKNYLPTFLFPDNDRVLSALYGSLYITDMTFCS